MSEKPVTRRSFLGQLLAGTLVVGLTGVIGSVIAYLFPPSGVRSALGSRRVKVARADDIPLGEGKLALVDSQLVWVIHLARGFAALSGLCTHRGCIIDWEENRRLFSCPCHRGLFDEQGNVIGGLPRRALRHFAVGVIHGDVYVSPEESPPT